MAKKFEEPMAKVKALTKTRWDKEEVKKGQTLEIPENVLDQNPEIFERVTDEAEPAKKDAAK